MSSQAERIKAFKLAQHARLQKQDEEEQWISSEELCTEGSSDEETHTSSSSTKSSHRKQKRNPRTEKRGISPLAQPPKTTETEATSTYQRDSKYLLPDVHTPSKVTEKRDTPGIDQPETLKLQTEATDFKSIDTKVEKLDLRRSSEAHSSKAWRESQDSEASDEEDEIEKMIQWRPKRGSIKLPDFPEGLRKPSTISHAIFEVDAFYTEMVAKLNFLKRKPMKYKYTLFCEDHDDHKSCERNLSFEKLKGNPNVRNMLEKISKLETEISEKNVFFEAIKKERQLVQEEMCNAVIEMDLLLANNKDSQIFLQLCNFENSEHSKDENEEGNENNKSSDQQAKKQKKTEKPDKNFVTRNIQLAKQHSMAQCSLTDEEKLKLESLLSDIDSEEDSLAPFRTEDSEINLKSLKMQIKKEIGENNLCSAQNEYKGGRVNHFKLQQGELTSIEDLDVKLHEIMKSYNETDHTLKQVIAGINEGEDLFQSADKEGKYWKHHQLQKRLEIIEKDLADIAVKDAEEQKKLEKRNKQCLEENDKLEEEEEEDDGSGDDDEEQE